MKISEGVSCLGLRPRRTPSSIALQMILSLIPYLGIETVNFLSSIATNGKNGYKSIMDFTSWRNLFDIFEATELNDLSK